MMTISKMISASNYGEQIPWTLTCFRIHKAVPIIYRNELEKKKSTTETMEH